MSKFAIQVAVLGVSAAIIGVTVGFTTMPDYKELPRPAYKPVQIEAPNPFEDIQLGMTFRQVMDKVGVGVKISESSVGGTYTMMVKWEKSGHVMTGVFQNNTLMTMASF